MVWAVCLSLFSWFSEALLATEVPVFQVENNSPDDLLMLVSLPDFFTVKKK